MVIRKFGLVVVAALVASGPVLADPHAVLEIDIRGMTCPFCAYGITKNLVKLPGVDEAEVSLKSKKARVVMEPGLSPDEPRIRDVIVDAGFTPGLSELYTEGA
jgi:copper chaperone CopZ